MIAFPRLLAIVLCASSACCAGASLNLRKTMLNICSELPLRGQDVEALLATGATGTRELSRMLRSSRRDEEHCGYRALVFLGDARVIGYLVERLQGDSGGSRRQYFRDAMDFARVPRPYDSAVEPLVRRAIAYLGRGQPDADWAATVLGHTDSELSTRALRQHGEGRHQVAMSPALIVALGLHDDPVIRRLLADGLGERPTPGQETALTLAALVSSSKQVRDRGVVRLESTRLPDRTILAARALASWCERGLRRPETSEVTLSVRIELEEVFNRIAPQWKTVPSESGVQCPPGTGS